MSDLEGIGNVQGIPTVLSQNYQDPRNKEQLTKQAIKKSDASAEPTLNLGHESDNRAQLEEDVALLNEIGASQPPALKFNIDDETGRTIVRMMDRETNEVLRQIPGEDFMAIARIVRENGDSLTERPGQWVELNA